MKKNTWKSKIKKACIEAGTYKPCFDHVIGALAGQLARRDEAESLLEREGEQLIIEKTNQAGYTNQFKNPAYTVWLETSKLALTYMAALGLTPVSLEKINDEAFQKDKDKKSVNNLMAMLNEKRKAIKEGNNGD